MRRAKSFANHANNNHYPNHNHINGANKRVMNIGPSGTLPTSSFTYLGHSSPSSSSSLSLSCCNYESVDHCRSLSYAEKGSLPPPPLPPLNHYSKIMNDSTYNVSFHTKLGHFLNNSHFQCHFQKIFLKINHRYLCILKSRIKNLNLIGSIYGKKITIFMTAVIR